MADLVGPMRSTFHLNYALNHVIEKLTLFRQLASLNIFRRANDFY